MNSYDQPPQTYGQPTQDEKTMAILAHVLTLVVWFVAPLVIYLSKKDQPSFALEHAKESLNFQLSLIIYFFAAFILMVVIVGIFLLAAIGIFAFIVVIVATIKAANGEMYRYPLCMRFIK
jgi:uncharacterized Tic20 family protein